jgi:hypothetical protein
MLCVVSVVTTMVIGVDIGAHNNCVIIDGFTFCCYSLFFLPPPTLPFIRLRLKLIFGKIICMSIPHMLLDQHASMTTFILHETFSRFGCFRSLTMAKFEEKNHCHK